MILLPFSKDRHFISLCRDDGGYVLVVSIIILSLLTILGIASTTTSVYEIKISSNDRSRKTAFYAAEAGRAYVEAKPALYSSGNIIQDSGAAIKFPEDPQQDWLPLPASTSVQIRGKVLYIGSMNPPRGSGFSIKSARAHVYKMTCEGRDLKHHSLKTIEAGFYRIGL